MLSARANFLPIVNVPQRSGSYSPMFHSGRCVTVQCSTTVGALQSNVPQRLVCYRPMFHNGRCVTVRCSIAVGALQSNVPKRSVRYSLMFHNGRCIVHNSKKNRPHLAVLVLIGLPFSRLSLPSSLANLFSFLLKAL